MKGEAFSFSWASCRVGFCHQKRCGKENAVTIMFAPAFSREVGGAGSFCADVSTSIAFTPTTSNSSMMFPILFDSHLLSFFGPLRAASFPRGMPTIH